MAFYVNNLTEVRALGNNRWHWHYFTTDTLATVLGADYFSTADGLAKFHRGDVLEIVASTAAEYQQVSIRSASGGHVVVGQSTALASRVTAEAADTLGASDDVAGLVCTADCTVTVDTAANLLNGFCAPVVADGGTVTLAGLSGSVSIPSGQSVAIRVMNGKRWCSSPGSPAVTPS